MKESLILKTAVRLLLALLLVFAIFILLRGHDEPGGGFIGGLMAAGAIVLYSVAYGSAAARDILRVGPRVLIGLGLVFGAISGLLALLSDEPFLTGQWWLVDVGDWTLPLSSVLVFDIGVFFVVVGCVTAIVLSLADIREDWPENGRASAD